MPSDVSSKAQARINARGKPINAGTVTKVAVHAGTRSIGKVVAVTLINSQTTIT